MGEEARWVCHTCKTVCNRGGTPIIIRQRNDIYVEEIDGIRSAIAELGISIELHRDLRESWIGFLDDLREWVSRHKDHNIFIGSDYTTDHMDLDDYRDETVDGDVADYTRLEAQTRTAEEWRNAGIEKIAGIIMSCVSNGVYGTTIDVKATAEKLYDQFCSDMAAELGG